MPGPHNEGNRERLANPESRPVPSRTGLVIGVDSLVGLTDPEPLPLHGINISPKTLGRLFTGEFRPMSEPGKRTTESVDGTRKEDSLVAVAAGERAGEIVRVSGRVLEVTGSRPTGLTEIHSSPRRKSNFEAIYVPEGEKAILTYPSHYEQTGGGRVSYGELVRVELSGAIAVMPGGVPYDIAPANGESVRYMHATNDSFVENLPKQVSHVEALNIAKDGKIEGSAIYARGHGLGMGREVKGLQGEETMIVREINPEVTISDIIDTRNLVPDSVPRVISEKVLFDTKALS